MSYVTADNGIEMKFMTGREVTSYPDQKDDTPANECGLVFVCKHFSLDKADTGSTESRNKKETDNYIHT